MNENMTGGSMPYSGEGGVEPLNVYTAKTFGWMFLGLLFTFAIALMGVITPLPYILFSVPYMPFILLIAELGVVIYLSARVHRMSVTTARVLFFVYAALNGIVFSAYFFLYELSSLVFVFGLTALYFGIMAAFGYFTKRDLSSWRPILLSGVIFLAVFWVLSIFIGFGAFERLVCFLGVAIFLGFTAYDTQKIRAFHAAFGSDPEMAAKASIISALELYLDFINLFLYLIRLLGKRRS